ncbi:MAG: 3-deoxy-7-phosphoheptulonate synthase [Pseudomonadota bacterium]
MQSTPQRDAGPGPHGPDAAVRPLPSPHAVKSRHALSQADRLFVSRTRTSTVNVLRGRDPRLLAIVGPCSVHRVDEALDYADRLATLAHSLDDALLVLMRVYIEKPRTTVGWRGLAVDPALDGSRGPDDGLEESRRLMLGVTQRGVGVATESLDPFVLPYVDDLLSFTSIGARTVTSQTHRQMAAAVGCPVGVKNAVCGSVALAADAAVSIAEPQWVLGLDEDGRAACRFVSGNGDAALVLRGGEPGPNYASADQHAARAALAARGVTDAVLVDCSHGNSGKVARNQLDVVSSVVLQIDQGDQPPNGIMLESQLQHGRQTVGPDGALAPGVSITDECLGFDETAEALAGLAAAVRRARVRDSALEPSRGVNPPTTLSPQSA